MEGNLTELIVSSVPDIGVLDVLSQMNDPALLESCNSFVAPDTYTVLQKNAWVHS